MIKVSFEILGKRWTLRVLKRRKYARKNGKDSVALTYMARRRIDLSPFGTDYETIVHELVHCYLTELCASSADLDVEELEEVYAELMAKFGRQLLDLATDLHNKVKKATEPTVLL